MQNLAISSDPLLAAVWLGALIDGEGCVWVGKIKTGPHAGETRRTITIGMCDREVIDFAAHCLVTLGVRHNLHMKKSEPPRRDVWVLCISGGRGLRLLSEVLTLTHAGKAGRLAEIAGGYKPPRCSGCGVALSDRTRDCEACQQRMKYRRKNGLPNSVGRTGRLPKAVEA